MTSRLEKIKELIDMGIPHDEILRAEKEIEAEMLKRAAVKEALRQVRAERATYKDAGSDEHQKFIAELWKELEPRIREIIKLQSARSPQITDADVSKRAVNHDLKIPVGDRQSVQKEWQADPLGAFMAGVGMQLQPSKKTKAKRARTPFDDVMQGRWQ